MFCRDSKGHILFSNDKKNPNVPVLVVEATVIRMALRAVTFRDLNNIMAETTSKLSLIQLREK